MNTGTQPSLPGSSNSPGERGQPGELGEPRVRGGAARWFSLQRIRSHIAALTAASRVTGIDVARALAIIGMIGAHVGYAPDIYWSDPSTWGGVIHGRSAILFAVLAGVSIALVSGGARGVTGAGLDIRKVRLGLVGRGIFIFAVGLVLEALGTSVSVILGIYGLLFVLAAVFVDWSRKLLLITAGVLALGGPSLLVVLRAVAGGGDGDALTIFAYSMYPPLVWLVFVMAGLVVGRSDVRRLRTALVTTAAGVVLAVLGYAVGIGIAPAEGAYDEAAFAEDDGLLDEGSLFGGTPIQADELDLTAHECEIDDEEWVYCYPAEDLETLKWAMAHSGEEPPEEGLPDKALVEEADLDEAELETAGLDGESLEKAPLIAESVADAGLEGDSADEDYGSYVRAGLKGEVFLEEGFGVYEHSGGTMEIIGSGGFALAVTGLSLLAFRARLLRRLVFPVAALGSMPLTAYATHIVAIRLLTDPWDYLEDNQTWLLFVISLVLGCTLWALLWGRGPLERMTGWAARALSAAPTHDGAPADPPARR